MLVIYGQYKSGVFALEALVKLVSKVGLNMSTCVGQGYDGTASLAGEHTGAASRFLTDAKKAQYYHCAKHHSNLCAVFII